MGVVVVWNLETCSRRFLSSDALFEARREEKRKKAAKAARRGGGKGCANVSRGRGKKKKARAESLEASTDLEDDGDEPYDTEGTDFNLKWLPEGASHDLRQLTTCALRGKRLCTGYGMWR